MNLKKMQEGAVQASRAAKESAATKFPSLTPGSNVDLIVSHLVQQISEGKKPTYVECGVFTGNAFMSVKEFLDQTGSDYRMFGVDSFEGFPTGVVNEHDHPKNFIEQHGSKKISDLALEMARQRTKDFTDTSHLTGEYFRRDDLIDLHRERLAGQDKAKIVVGPFSDSLRTFDCDQIDLLFLDCDLYESYKVCLEMLYDRVTPGGVIVFDEVYSYKYPGARDAVDEFFAARQDEGSFEVYEHPSPFERWCFVRKA